MVHLQSVMWPVMGSVHQRDIESGEGDDMLFTRAAVIGFRPERREVDVIASTEALDAHGTIMRQNWNLDRFQSNPVVLWAHDRKSVPIGKALRAKVAGNKKEGRRLEATIALRDAEVSPRAEEVFQALSDDTLRGVSVGFKSHSTKWEKQEDRDLLVLDDNELFELSFCPVPSNPDTLATLRARMLEERSHNDSAPSVGGSDSSNNQEEPEMSDTKTLARAAGLPEAATEAQLVERMTALQSDRARVLAALEVESVDAAIGAIEAGREATKQAAELTARVAELEKATEATERAAIVAGLKRDKDGHCRLSPAQEKDLIPTLSLEGLKAFAKTAPVIVRKSENQEPGSHSSSGSERETHEGKRFEQMSGNELVALRKADTEAFTRLHDDWVQAGQPPRDL